MIAVDRGLYLTTDDPTHAGRFKTPTVRNVAEGDRRAYMHNGVLVDLLQVVDSYNTRDVLPVCDDPTLHPAEHGSSDRVYEGIEYTAANWTWKRCWGSTRRRGRGYLPMDRPTQLLRRMEVRAFVISFIAIAWSVVPADAQGRPPGFADQEPVHVMVLGSFHMAGSTRNVVNNEAADLHSEEGRAEIDAVLDRLEEFAPDKIMLEVYPERMDTFNARYAALLAGTYQPSLDESEQLGMQLAARLGHDRLYGIDYSAGLDYRPALALAEELGQEDILADQQALIAELQAESEGEGDMTVLERLIALNSDHFTHTNAFYLNVARMGTVQNPLGALQIADWWKRNLVIFARAARYSEPGDRVLIVFGSGHKHQLERHFREARGFKLVDPLTYLEQGS